MLTNLMVELVNRVPGFIAAGLKTDRTKGALRPLLNRLLPSGPTPVIVRSGPATGMRLLILPREEKYYWTGSHEPQVQQALQRLLRPGMTFWDVGAHIGFFSCLAARLVGAGGKVVAFEPQGCNRERLVACLAINSLENVTVRNCALSARSGPVFLHSHRSSPMWTLIEGLGEKEGQQVSGSTLDDEAQVYPSPQVIKVDAEGAELDVLRGGRNLLLSRKPTLIAEFSDEEFLETIRNRYPFYSSELVTPRHVVLTAR